MTKPLTNRCECTCGKDGCASVRGPQHGRASTYRAGCRCTPCCEAEAIESAEKSAARAAVTAPTATKAGQQWTGAEMELVMRNDLPVTDIARMLGRTYKAVVARRALCRNDPKWQRIP